MIRIATTREPVTVALTGPYAGVTLTLKRLTSADYGEAQQAAHAIVTNDALLLSLLVEHDLLPKGGVKGWKRLKTHDLMGYAAFLSGIGVWLSAVECGVRGIDGWTGIMGEGDAAASVSRETIEVLMLDEGFQRQAMAELDKAARILIVEGKP